MSTEQAERFEKSRPIHVSIYLRNGSAVEFSDFSLDKFKVFLEQYKAYIEHGAEQEQMWFPYHSKTFEENGANPTDSRLWIDFSDILLVRTTDESMYK